MPIKPFIVGCDPSSKKIAFFASQPITLTNVAQGYIISKKNNAKYEPGNLLRAERASLDFLRTANSMAPAKAERFLIIEEPLMGRGGVRTTVVQSLVSGVIQKCFYEAGYTIYMVNLQTWKAHFGIAGKTTKGGKAKTNFTKLALQGEYPKEVMACGDDHDLLDSLGICQWGIQAVRRGNVVAEARDM